MYHCVSTVSDGPLRSLAVPAPVLTEQLTALREAGYELLGLTAALDRLTADPTAAVVAVTFDDGFLDFATDGGAVLAEVGAGATLYLAVGHLGQSAVWLGSRGGDCSRLLTWAEVRSVVRSSVGPLSAVASSAAGPSVVAASRPGLEIGSHGLIHVPLDVLPAGAVVKQVAAARDRLEQHIESPVPSFAYPHGY